MNYWRISFLKPQKSVQRNYHKNAFVIDAKNFSDFAEFPSRLILMTLPAAFLEAQ